MEGYTISGRIGQGAHGIVMKAHHKATGKEVALKKINFRKPHIGVPVHVLREILCLKLVDCEFVVELKEVITESVGCMLVFEFMPSGLWEMIHDLDYILSESEIKRYMIMLLCGVAYLHGQNIMHRDLKPANLLVNKDGILKIADFGLGRTFYSDKRVAYSHQVATRWYRAPELLYGARYYNEGVDMWAVGCIFAEMLNNVPLFPGDSDIEQLGIVLHTLGTPTDKTWPGMRDLPDYNKISFPDSPGKPFSEIVPDANHEIVSLISRFVSYDSLMRPSAKEALSNPYFFMDPLPCSMYELPRPDPNHRGKFFRRPYIDVEKPVEDLFEDLSDLLAGCGTSINNEYADGNEQSSEPFSDINF